MNPSGLFLGCVPCVMCDRIVFDPTRVTCSAICRDLWLGELAELPAPPDWGQDDCDCPFHQDGGA